MQFEDLILELEKKEEEIRVKWNRVIPRTELFNDRWNKAKLLKFEEGANIYDSSFVFGEVKVGEKTWIGPYTILDGTGGLTIGKYCNISAGVQIYTHSSLNWVLTEGNSKYEYSNTTIGNGVYIGSQCIIDKGVTIGDHSIVAANSYVNKSFSNNSVIAGSPAKQIGEVEISDTYDVKINYFTKSF